MVITEGVPAAASRTIVEGVKEDEFGAKDYRDDFNCVLTLTSGLYGSPLMDTSSWRLSLQCTSMHMIF